jgi:hypothetical protein
MHEVFQLKYTFLNGRLRAIFITLYYKREGRGFETR